MNKKPSTVLLTLFLLSLFPGCATLSSGQDQWIKVELYFGAEVPGTDPVLTSGPYEAITDVTDEMWKEFITEVMTPAFPEGFTVLEGTGGWERGGSLILEKSRVVVVLFLSSSKEEKMEAVRGVAALYTQKFNQDAVMLVSHQSMVEFLQ